MIVRQDAETYLRLRAEKDSLEERKRGIAERQVDLEKSKKEITLLSASLDSEKKRVEQAMEERAYYLQRVQAERTRWERELAEEERQSRELEKVIREMQARLGKSGQLAKWTGKFIWPVAGGRPPRLLGGVSTRSSATGVFTQASISLSAPAHRSRQSQTGTC